MWPNIVRGCLILVLAANAAAQQREESGEDWRMPTIADYAYGTESERQKLDFFRPSPIKPTPVVVMIHGGGWTGGDKSGYQSKVIEPYLDAGISVARDQLPLHRSGDGAGRRSAGEGVRP